MGASFALNKNEDAEKYSRELLKLQVGLYNLDQIDKNSLLASYLSLIDAQIKNKKFKNAQKTLKMIKIFNLNSMNPQDIRTGFEQENLIKKFPGLYPGWDFRDCDSVGTDENRLKEYYYKLTSNETDREESINFTDICYKVSHIGFYCTC